MELRACAVNGKKALFHKWIKKEEIVIKPNTPIKTESIRITMDQMISKGIIPVEMDVEKIKNTFGLVEFEDGLVQIIKPEEIKFLDTGNKFMDQAVFVHDFDNSVKKPWNDDKCPYEKKED